MIERACFTNLAIYYIFSAHTCKYNAGESNSLKNTISIDYDCSISQLKTDQEKNPKKLLNKWLCCAALICIIFWSFVVFSNAIM